MKNLTIILSLLVCLLVISCSRTHSHATIKNSGNNEGDLISKIEGTYTINSSYGTPVATQKISIQKVKIEGEKGKVASEILISVAAKNESASPPLKNGQRWPRDSSEKIQIEEIVRGIIRITYPFEEHQCKHNLVVYIYEIDSAPKEDIFYYAKHKKNSKPCPKIDIKNHTLSHGSGTRD